ncbi:MAG TPA: hypothetical protein VJ788_02440 [Gemmatimonadota bacterium]|nr:hypothetical protein [Gemmatimonadota bacterium]
MARPWPPLAGRSAHQAGLSRRLACEDNGGVGIIGALNGLPDCARAARLLAAREPLALLNDPPVPIV